MQQVEVRKLPAEAATSFLPLVGVGIREFPEMQGRPFKEAFVRVVRSIEANDRIELIATQYGEMIGGIVLVLDDDQHVGPCCSLQWAYVPAGNPRVGAALYRTARQVARKIGAPYLCYTKRVGEGEYRVIYRQLKKD